MSDQLRILLLGANGYLGARLYYDLRDNFDVVGTYHRNKIYKEFFQLDVTDETQVSSLFRDNIPDVIIHTANYPSPRQAADNEEGFKKLNLTATKHVVNAANKIGAKVVFISSFAAYNPDNVYGKFKLASEEIIKTAKFGYLILRASLILGYSPNTANDRPFDRVLKVLGDKTKAEFDVSWKFQPTYIGHVSDVIRICLYEDIFNEVLPVFCDSIQTQFSTAKDILKPFAISVKPIDKK